MAVGVTPPFWVLGAGGALGAPLGPMPPPRIIWVVPRAVAMALTGA